MNLRMKEIKHNVAVNKALIKAGIMDAQVHSSKVCEEITKAVKSVGHTTVLFEHCTCGKQ